MKIPSNEIVRRTISNADSFADLFEWKKELYRGIRGGRADLYRAAFESGVIDDMCRNHGLIESEVVDLEVDGYSLVLKHRRLPVVSYCFEWPGLMIQEAALAMLRLMQALQPNGLTLRDGHPWNVIFDCGHPVFVDFGSLKQLQGDRDAYFFNEFACMMYYPLRLLEKDLAHAARWLMRSREGVSHREYLLLTKTRQMIPYRLRQVAKRFGLDGLARSKSMVTGDNVAPLQQISRLHDLVEAIKFPRQQTVWSRYGDANYASLTDVTEWTTKQKSVNEVLTRIRPSSVTDIGANRGWFSQLAASLGARVIAVDTDEDCMNDLYAKVREKNENIHPVIMNVANPTPAEGIDGNSFPAASQRFQSEFVMANAVVHHLVFTSQLHFEQIVPLLASFGSRWLLVEFMDRDYKYVKEWLRPQHDWYTRQLFETTLRKVYRTIQTYPSNGNDRVIYFCER